MALTAYPAILPTLNIPLTTGNAWASGTIFSPALPVWNPGDYAVILVASNGTADPTSVVAFVSSVAFTKVFSGANGISVWIGLNNTSSITVNEFANVTFAAATEAYTAVALVTNASSYVVGAGVTNASKAQNTDITVGTVTPGSGLASAMLLACVGVKRTSSAVHTQATLVPQFGKPACIGANQAISNPAGAAQTNAGLGAAMAASSGELLFISGASDYGVWVTDALGAVATAGCMIAFQAITVSLDDNTLQVDEGPLINNPSNTLPLYDIDSITGLSGFDVTNDTSAIDGTSGAYVSGKFQTGRTIVVAGTIWSATAPFDESLLDVLKQNLAPGYRPHILFFKPANKTPREVNVIPIQLQSDIDRNRSISQCPYQMQFLTQDSNTFSLDAKTIGFNQSFTTVGGTAEAYPLIYFNIYAADIGNTLTLWNTGWQLQQVPALASSANISISLAGATKGMYKLDMKTRILWRLDATGPVDVSNMITNRTWFTLIPGQYNFLRFGSITETPLCVFREAWL